MSIGDNKLATRAYRRRAVNCALFLFYFGSYRFGNDGTRRKRKRKKSRLITTHRLKNSEDYVFFNIVDGVFGTTFEFEEYVFIDML